MAGSAASGIGAAWRARAMRFAYRVAWFGLRVQWRVYHPVTLGVRVLLLRDDEVLLVRHTYRDGWFLPGGGVKRRERLADAARREAREEAGATLRDLVLVGLYANFGEHKSDHVALFASSDFDVTGEHDEEIASVEWFALDALPADVSRGTRDRIAEFRSGKGPFTGRW
jgi:8-oxo-dGTP pyrophosphatase MutT (NUDIX family)